MKKLNLCVDMYGCPNRCKHCWLGHFQHTAMDENADEYIVNYFRPYFEEIAFYSWFREPDFTNGYEARWEKDNRLSVNTAPQRFELASFYRLCRDKNYVDFLKHVEVEKVQLTLFGMEEMTDKYIGRKGAFGEILTAADILMDNGITPRYQVFINKENKEDIPPELIKYYADYDKLYSEKECYELLKDDLSHHVYHNEDEITLYITSDYSVYYNFENISENWKAGNIKSESAESLVAKLLDEDTFALNEAKKVTVSKLVELYGNFASNRAFSLEDYKGYLLNRHIESLHNTDGAGQNE